MASQFPQLEILELLGLGGMGMVYKARQPRLDRLVALKILPLDSMPDPSFAERFEREAKALARLNHPGIVTLYDFGQTREYYYFIMEYVDGMNLRQLIRAKTLEPRQALELVTQICGALQFAHDEKIVHRDIKPENILITKKGQVKIADFGLAKLLGGRPDTTLTASQMVMGTMNYMAPEQRENTKDVDHRADIYSLGVVFYEMLTGEVPMGRFEPPSKKVQVDVRLDEVVLHALEREPARRYQHASEVKSNVETITSTTPAMTQPPDAPASLAPKRLPASGSSWLVFFVVELVLTLGLGALLWQFAPALGVVWIVAVFLVASYQLNSRKEMNDARENGLWPQFGEIATLEHVRLLARAGKQRLAIKLHRQIHGVSAAAAKMDVEKLSGQGVPASGKFELFPKEWSATHAGHVIRVRNSWNRSLKLFVDDVCRASTDRIIIVSKSRPLLRYELASGGSSFIIEVYCYAVLEVKVKIVVNGQWIGGDNF
jgi:predicted Ser/Thr protein kinase